MGRKILICFLFLSSILKSQGEFNNWIFGDRAGLNFGSGPPFGTGPWALVTTEGLATISDAAGNLLFFTNGTTIWCSDNSIMVNGTGLFGDPSSSQSAVILQQIGNPDRYYVFTAPASSVNNPLAYSIVDMTLNGGLGEVVLKNVPLYTPSCEKIAVVRHCNNRDAWLVSHDIGSNVYRVFPITISGVGLPITSAVGVTVSTLNVGNPIGYLKASPFGNKLSVCHYGLNRGVLVDFNNSTGVVSNEITASGTPLIGPYGTEFSPNGRYVYYGYNNGARILQVDVCNAVSTSFNLLPGIGPFFGALQLGPDGKIYGAKLNSTSMCVINNPNVFGAGANAVLNQTPLVLGTNSRFGLPNFAQYYTRTHPEEFTFSIDCEIVDFVLPDALSVNTCVYNFNLQSVEWSFGDGNISYSNNPTHAYSSDGIFNVRLIMEFPCYNDTLYDQVTIDANLTPQPIYTNQ